MVDGVPVAELVGDVEVHGAAGGGIGHRCRQLVQGHALTDEREHVVEGLVGLAVEDLVGEITMAAPVPQPAATGHDGVVELAVHAREEGGEVDGVAPAGALLHAARAREAGDDGGEDLLGVLPADVVEQLEGLVGEVEGVAGIEEEVVGAGGEDHLGDGGGGQVEVDGGAQGAFGGLRGARLDEAAEPLQVAVRVAQLGLQRGEVEVGWLVRSRAGDVDRAVEDGEGAVLLVEDGEDVGHGGKDGEAGAPAVGAIAHAEEGGLAKDVAGGVELVQADDALREHQRELALQPLAQLRLPVGAAVGFDGARVDVDVAVACFDAEGGHVVGEGVEGAAAGEVELGVVPVAGEDAVADGAAAQGEAHVGAAIVEGVEAALIVDDEDGASLGRDDLHTLALDLLDGAGADEDVLGWGGGHGAHLAWGASSMPGRGRDRDGCLLACPLRCLSGCAIMAGDTLEEGNYDQDHSRQVLGGHARAVGTARTGGGGGD